MEIDKSRYILDLSDIEHALARSQMYCGGMSPAEFKEWILTDDDTIVSSKITYTEGLLKIINEVLDNSIDEGLRTNWEYSNKISIEIKDSKITIADNGRGLPIIKNNSNEWMPVSAFCKAKSGSNFNDAKRPTIGLNGLGGFLANCLSSSFEVITCDGNKKLKLVCKDNLSSEKHTVADAGSSKPGTTVKFIPDYKRFGVEDLPKSIETMLRTRLRMLSWFYPKCEFRYNGEKMSIKAKDFANMFPNPRVVLSTDNVYIVVYGTDEPEVMTYVDGLSLRRGGTHVSYVTDGVVNAIRDKISKKYKTIKPADIKNRLGMVILFKDFPSCQFDSQTKESLSNSEKDISSYLKENDVDLDKLYQKVIKEKAIVDNITEIFQLKENLKEKKELQKMNTKKKDIDSTKYFPAIGDKKYLCITEGQSAFGGIAPVLGRRGISYYQIKGKILNVQNLSLKKAMENEEVNDLVNILGIDLSNPESDMTYEKVIISSDADADGSHIAALICSLFNKVCPRMVKEGRLCRLNTPILVGTKNGNVTDYFFTLPDQASLDPKVNWRYQKGLGGWGGENKKLLQQIMDKEGGLDGLLMSLTPEISTQESLENWMGDSADYRKQCLRGKEFHIDMM